MNIHVRIPKSIFQDLHADLSRPHPHALERVAFVSCRPAALPGSGLLLLVHALHPVADEDYERSDEVGAMLSGAAFRKALQYAFNNSVSMFHVHRHEHRGHPRFSPVDLRESAKFVPDFWKVRPGHPHGAIVLSRDSAFGLVWHQQGKPAVPIAKFIVAGYPQCEVGHDRV
jgi:hypothetical protein